MEASEKAREDSERALSSERDRCKEVRAALQAIKTACEAAEKGRGAAEASLAESEKQHAVTASELGRARGLLAAARAAQKAAEKDAEKAASARIERVRNELVVQRDQAVAAARAEAAEARARLAPASAGLQRMEADLQAMQTGLAAARADMAAGLEAEKLKREAAEADLATARQEILGLKSSVQSRLREVAAAQIAKEEAIEEAKSEKAKREAAEAEKLTLEEKIARVGEVKIGTPTPEEPQHDTAAPAAGPSESRDSITETRDSTAGLAVGDRVRWRTRKGTWSRVTRRVVRIERGQTEISVVLEKSQITAHSMLPTISCQWPLPTRSRQRPKK